MLYKIIVKIKSDLPGNRGSPVSISAKIHPADHMSIFVEYSRCPKSSSGARSIECGGNTVDNESIHQIKLAD